jgi:hypothetical protein
VRSDDGVPAVVATTWMRSEASVIKSLLESYHIPCHFASDLPHEIYPMNIDGIGQIRIYVPATVADEARRILAEHRRIHAHLRLIDPGSDPS